VDDVCVVSCLHAGSDLADDVGHDVHRQGSVLLGVLIQNFPAGPLDGEKMQPILRLPDFDRLHDIGVLDPGSVFGFPEEARNRSTVLPELLA